MPISLAERLPEYARYADVPPCYDPEKALNDFNGLTSEQKGKLATGMAVTASSNEADAEFKKASSAAAKAVENIDAMFVNLNVELKSLQDAEDFVTKFTAIKTIFRGTVKDSHTLAVSVAQYADSFDKIIIKFCADETISLEERKSQIQGFISKAEKIGKDAGSMADRFVGLKDKFSDFVATFSSWARTREETDGKKIKDIYIQIKHLDEQITAIESAMAVMAAALATTLPATAILALLFPPAAPFIMAGGCALAGVELTSLVGLAIAKTVLVNEKREDENKIKDLQDEISKIKATRTQLETSGKVDVATFTDNISVIQNVWTQVTNDATEIQGWLDLGATQAAYPKYMKDNLDEGVNIYTTMAKYLRDYANDVTETVETFKE